MASPIMTKPVSSPFAEWLARQMQLRGMNQSVLARELKTTHGTVWSWLNRGVQPSSEMCGRIARLFGVPVQEVLELADRITIDDASGPVLPDWARLLPMLSKADAEYVGRLVESMARNPVQPDEPPSPEAPR